MSEDVNKQAEEVLNMTEINLGDTVVDTVTGFQGIATKRQEELGALPRMCVERPRLLECGCIDDEVWFPEARLKKVK
jgi:hypothetical protein